MNNKVSVSPEAIRLMGQINKLHDEIKRLRTELEWIADYCVPDKNNDLNIVVSKARAALDRK